MIKAEFYVQLDGTIEGFEVEGHAEAGPYGHDLVCAAVSAVTTGAVNAVLVMANKSMLSMENRNGYIMMDINPGVQYEVQVILQTLKISLLTIEGVHPENIEVKECEPQIKSYEKWENKNNDN